MVASAAVVSSKNFPDMVLNFVQKYKKYKYKRD